MFKLIFRALLIIVVLWGLFPVIYTIVFILNWGVEFIGGHPARVRFKHFFPYFIDALKELWNLKF